MSLDIQGNRSANKYSRKELLLRVLWGVGKITFRLTPRPCFGLRRALLRLFGAKVGTRVHIYPSANIYFPWNLEIGKDSSIGEWALIYNLGRVTIAESVTISQRVHLCAGTHNYKCKEMTLVKLPIKVCSQAWVCADAFVGPNVEIGERAIVGAASVVMKDIKANEIVGGNPAELIKIRDNE